MSRDWSGWGQQRILASPIKLHWAGWETTTLQLQQAGWELSAVQDPYRDSITFAIRHEQIGMRGITPPLEFSHRVLDECGIPHHMPVRLQHMAGNIVVRAENWGNWDFQPIDATPQMSQATMTSLDDLCHFPKLPLVRTQAIVLPEKTVDALLADILEKQQGAKMDYFRDLVRREGSLVPEHKFHAQIISLKDAA